MNTEHFYPELARVYPNYPWLTFDRALNAAARTLCTLGLVWRVDLEPLYFAEGTQDVALFPPPDTRIVQLIETAGLTKTTPEQLARLDEHWRTRLGRPTHVFPLSENAVGLYPLPVEEELDALTVRAAIAPTTERKTLNDEYAWAHEQLLLQGALAYLGRTEWPVYEQLCRQARSLATDGMQVGVARTIRYGGL